MENKRPDSSVDDLLDIFEDAAFLVRIGALDIEMVWHSFYYWIRLYHQAAENYIIETQCNELVQWKEFCDLYPRLNSIEEKRRRKAGIRGRYTAKLDIEVLRQQLNEELSASPRTGTQSEPV